MTKQSLDDLRREIDEIDDAIHDLILRRAEVVIHVASAKKGAKLPVRPAREASMLRRLAARHSGPFPISALARIWHEMMSAFTMIQASYKIAVLTGDGHHAMWDLARDQFGSQVPMTSHETRQETLQQVMSGDADIAVLPPPEDTGQTSWWPALVSPGAPVIVQRMPFARSGNARGQGGDAVAVAHLDLEATGDDSSYIVLRTDEQTSRSRLVTAMNTHGMKAVLLETVEQHGEWLSLARVDEFVAPDDARLQALMKDGPVASCKVIGACARPIG